MNVKILKAVLASLKENDVAVTRPAAKGEDEQTLEFSTGIEREGAFKKALKAVAEEVGASWATKESTLSYTDEDEGITTDFVFNWDESEVTVVQYAGEEEEGEDDEGESEDDEEGEEDWIVTLAALIRDQNKIQRQINKLLKDNT